jgi:uncharacterized coiled-coil protein SlyX
MTTENNPPPAPGPGFSTRLGQALRIFLRTLARLLLILLVLALIGLALYYGIPAAYTRFIQPVQANTLKLESLQTSQAQVDQQMTQNLSGLQSRLGTLEAQNAIDAQVIATMQSRLTSVDTSAGGAESQLKASTERLDALDASIKQISVELSAITTTLKSDQADIQGLAEKVQAGDPEVKSLYYELQLLKGMELITRSRLFLSQNNSGLAQQDIQSAYDLLGELQNQVPPYQTEAVIAVVQSLKQALANLPEAPILAADNLEVAWKLLVHGLPGQTPQAAEALGNIQFITPTITTSITSTLTLTITPSTVFTLTATMTPSPMSTSLPGSVTPTP